MLSGLGLYTSSGRGIHDSNVCNVWGLPRDADKQDDDPEAWQASVGVAQFTEHIIRFTNQNYCHSRHVGIYIDPAATWL